MTFIADDASHFPHAAAQHARVQINAVVSDLARLEGIVNHAAHELLASFADIQQCISGLDPQWVATPAFGAVNRAITAMQFHDLATQLVSGARQRLNATACGLAVDGPWANAFKNADDLPNSEYTEARLNHALAFPKQTVQQHDVGSGSIDLF